MLFLAVFFALASAAEYLFVKSQTTDLVVESLNEAAESINQQLHYTQAPDLKAYNKAYVEANAYMVVNHDGTVLDTQGAKASYAPDFLPKVSLPWAVQEGKKAQPN